MFAQLDEKDDDEHGSGAVSNQGSMSLSELGEELKDVEANRKSALRDSSTCGAGVPDTIHEGVEEDTFSDQGT